MAKNDDTRSFFPILVQVVRAVTGWNQVQLGKESGLGGSLICRYEGDKIKPTRQSLERIAAAAGLDLEVLSIAVKVLKQMRDQRLRVGDLESVASSMEELLSRIEVLGLLSEVPPDEPVDERAIATSLWERLKSRSHNERMVVVELSSEFQSWGLCLLICEQSRRAAANDARIALELATLAVRIADLAPGEEASIALLKAYAEAHLANALRVSGDVQSAATVFRRVKLLWQKGGPAVAQGLLPEAEVLQLEASLSRTQGRFQEALELLERASMLGADPVRIAIKKAFTHEQAGEYDSAVTILQAMPRPKVARDRFGRLFNLAVNLCHLDRYPEAAALLPEIQDLAGDLGNELDLVRLDWLRGRVAAGLEDLEQAASALSSVQEQFVARDITFDAVLVSLELAGVLLRKGQFGEVQSLASQLPRLCQVQGLHQEAVVAARLFWEAVQGETLTEELARRLVKSLYRNR